MKVQNKMHKSFLGAFCVGTQWFLANHHCVSVTRHLSSIKEPMMLLSDTSWYMDGEFFAILLSSEGPILVPLKDIRPWN